MYRLTPDKEMGMGIGREDGITADVVVIGGGPGGVVAAKTCAQHGMRTLLLERKKLPCHKVCCGFIPSNLARAIIDREFGAIPHCILADPPLPLFYHTGAYFKAKRWDVIVYMLLGLHSKRLCLVDT